MLVIEIQLNGAHATYSQLKESKIVIPSAARGVTAFRGTDVIPIRSIGSKGRVSVAGGDIFSGELYFGRYDTDMSVTTEAGKKINIRDPVWIEQDMFEEWVFEGEPAGVIVQADIDEIKWMPRYSVVLGKTNDEMLESFALSAHISNTGIPFEVDKIVLKAEKNDISHDVWRQMEATQHRGEIDEVCVHGEELSGTFKRQSAQLQSKSMTMAAPKTVAESISVVVQAEGDTKYMIDHEMMIEKKVIIPMWALRNAGVKRTYVYDGNNSIQCKLYVEPQKFMPKGELQVRDFDLMLVRTTQLHSGVIYLPTTDFSLKTTRTPGRFLMGKDTMEVAITSKKTKSVKFTINIHRYPVTELDVAPGANSFLLTAV